MPDGMLPVAPGSAGLVGLASLAPGMCWLQTIQLLWTRAIAERGHIDQADDLQDQVGRRNGVPTGLPPPPSLPARAGREDYTVITPNPGIGAITTTTLRAITRAAEGCAVDGQPGRALMIALDVEPLAIEANRLLQGLAILSRMVREEQRETEG